MPQANIYVPGKATNKASTYGTKVCLKDWYSIQCINAYKNVS